MAGDCGRKETRVKSAKESSWIIRGIVWSINRRPRLRRSASVQRSPSAARQRGTFRRRLAAYETERQSPVQSHSASVASPEPGWLVVQRVQQLGLGNLGADTMEACYL
jgi:hypothetical protein